MFLASIRGNNGKFIRVVDGRLVADQDFPTRETDMLISNLSHPHAMKVAAGDAVVIRSCATNGMWAVRQERVFQNRRFDVTGLHDVLRAAPLSMEARLPISRAVGTIKQFLRVQMPSARPPRPNLNSPLALTLTHSFPALWIGPGTSASQSFSMDSFRSPGFGMYPESATHTTTGLSVFARPAVPTEPAAIPDVAEISEIAFPRPAVVITEVIPELLTRADGAVQARGVDMHGPAGPISNWFYLAPHMIRARFKLPNGRRLQSGTPASAFVTTSGGNPVLENEFSITRLTEHALADAFGYRVYHNDNVHLRNVIGRFLRVPRPTATPARIAQASTVDEAPQAFTLERAAGPGEIEDGNAVSLRLQGTERRLKVNGDGSFAFVSNPADATKLIVEFTREVHLYRNAANAEFATLGEPVRTLHTPMTRVRSVGRAYLAPRPETSPVRSFISTPTGFYTSALEQGSEYAFVKGFTFRNIEGYAHTRTELGTYPLKLYRHDGKKQAFLALSKDDEQQALANGYGYEWVDAHLLSSREMVLAASVATATVTATIAGSGTAPAVFPGSLPAGATSPAGSPISTGFIPGVMISPRPTRALVLSGGGAKGCFEAGAAKYLWEQGWRPDIICGVSVGAVNAVKLAENRDNTADELIAQWRSFSSTPNRIFFRDMYVNFITGLADKLLGKAGDAGIAAGIAYFLGGGLPGALAGFFAGKEASQLDRGMIRFINTALNLFHSLHCMQPLRDLLAANIQPARLAESGVRLRLGVTDVQSGQFFTVSGPDATLGREFSNYGLIEAEPDHALGESWLTRPILGADHYAMRLDHAVYASSTLPVFMDPLVINMKQTTKSSVGGRTVAKLSTDLLYQLPNLIGLLRRYSRALDLMEPHLDYMLARFPELNSSTLNARERHGTDHDCGHRGNTRLLFDGGLRDTMPIRTAIRMGATEIVAVTGDRVQQSPFARPSSASLDSTYARGLLSLFNGRMFNGVGQSSVMPFSYLLGLLNIWLNEASRSDMLVSWAGNELMGWVKRGSQRMTPDQAREFQTEFDNYWKERGHAAFEALGASGFMGGRGGTSPYGTPWTSSPAKITYIAPDRDYIDALNFDDAGGVEDGLRLGYEAARNGITISNPVFG